MRRFEGKVVLVTGAASGIGRATVDRLASEGAQLFCADVQAEGAAAAAKAAAAVGAQAEARGCDVSDARDVAASVAACAERFGRIDGLVNMAGILRMGHFLELEFDAWSRMLAINLTGTLLMCQAALPRLLESRGAIVNASSSSALAGLPYGAAYGATKAGVQALTRGLAVEFGKRGLRANCVCPGSIATPMTQNTELPRNADMKLVRRQMPLDQPRGPETVASVIALLLSEDGAHINGEEIRVDGGTLA